MSFQIFIDSAGNVPAQIAKKYDINVLSFSEIVDGKMIECYNPHLTPLEERLEGKKFYNGMRKGAKVSTSLLNSSRFEDEFRKVLAAGEDLIYISLSSGISGTFNAARLAAEELMEEFPGRTIRVVDSKNASLGQGLHAITASELRAKGKDVNEVADHIERLVPKMNGLFTVDNLKYLARTGRIKGSVATLGNMLNVKPILRGNKDGFIVEFKKVRGRRKSLDTIITLLIDNIIDPEDQVIGIAHADAYEEALECAKEIKNAVKVKDIIITSYDLCTGSHVGPDTIALFFLAKDRELSAQAGTRHSRVGISAV